MNSPKKKYRDQVSRIAAARKSRQEKAFERGLTTLRAYVAREKTADVPVMHIEGEYPLGRWIANQRAKYRRGETSNAHIRALEALPGWNWNAWDKDWPKAIKLLKAFQAREGHARCPAQHMEKGFALGAWAARQRARYTAGRLSLARAADLESLIGFTGNWKKAQSEHLWQAKFDALKVFATEHGHTQVPRSYALDGLGLGIWVNSVRSQHSKGVLSDERIAMLETIPGWEWARSRSESWAKGIERLNAYVSEHGSANVPRNYIDETGFRLGEWVGKRRSAYKTGRLTADEVQQLQAMPGWVWFMRQRKSK